MADSPLASPLPLSPTSSRPSSPVLQKPTSPGARTHHRRFGVLSFGCGLASDGDQASQSPTHLPNPIETFLQLRQDQVRRIAEYNRDSLIKLEDGSSDKVEVSFYTSCKHQVSNDKLRYGKVREGREAGTGRLG